MCTLPVYRLVKHENPFFDVVAPISKYVDANRSEKVWIKCSCGYCYECLKHKVSMWKFRNFCEVSQFKESDCSFVTFTYDDEHLALHFLNRDFKKDWSKFIMRLRRYMYYHYNIKGFRYFMTTEHGAKTGRLHRHVLFYGLPFFFGMNDELAKVWKNGFVYGEKLQKKNHIGYCVSYMMNPVPKDDESGSVFISTSRVPFGIGFIPKVLNKIRKYILRDYAKKHVIHSHYFIDGFRYRVPSVVMRKLLSEYERFERCTDAIRQSAQSFNEFYTRLQRQNLPLRKYSAGRSDGQAFFDSPTSLLTYPYSLAFYGFTNFQLLKENIETRINRCCKLHAPVELVRVNSVYKYVYK